MASVFGQVLTYRELARPRYPLAIQLQVCLGFIGACGELTRRDCERKDPVRAGGAPHPSLRLSPVVLDLSLLCFSLTLVSRWGVSPIFRARGHKEPQESRGHAGPSLQTRRCQWRDSQRAHMSRWGSQRTIRCGGEGRPSRRFLGELR